MILLCVSLSVCAYHQHIPWAHFKCNKNMFIILLICNTVMKKSIDTFQMAKAETQQKKYPQVRGHPPPSYCHISVITYFLL